MVESVLKSVNSIPIQQKTGVGCEFVSVESAIGHSADENAWPQTFTGPHETNPLNW